MATPGGCLVLVVGAPIGVLGRYLSSVAAVGWPGAGWGTPAFEEPVMLLGFILLGRALEARARLRAASSLVVSSSERSSVRCYVALGAVASVPCAGVLARSIVSLAIVVTLARVCA